MPHYHLHEEKRLDNGTTVSLNYVVLEEFAKHEQQMAVSMGYDVKWNRCVETLCLGSSLTQSA